MPDPIGVSGGTHGLPAGTARLRALATVFGDAAHDLGAATWALHGYLLDPAIAAAGIASAKEYACFAGDLADALDGPRGLTWVAAAFSMFDVELRAAAAAYEGADGAVSGLHDALFGVLDAPAAL